MAGAPSKAWHILGTQGGSNSPARDLSQGALSHLGVVVLGLQAVPVGCPCCLPTCPDLSDSLPLTASLSICLSLTSSGRSELEAACAPAWGPLCLGLHGHLTLPPPSLGCHQRMGSLSGFPLPQIDAAEQVTDEAWLITEL